MSEMEEAEQVILQNPDPVTGTSEVADELDRTNAHVLDLLKKLEYLGKIHGKKIGRSRVWWHEERDTDPILPPEEHPDQSELGESMDYLDEIVAEASESWDGTHVEERRAAARASLVWLREIGEPASASDFKDALLPSHSIDGRTAGTWWETTVRPVLNVAQDRGWVGYRAGHHDYRWTTENR